MSAQKIIRFMRYRVHTSVISLILVVASLISLAVNGLNLGLDFTGGTLVELHYSEAPELEVVREQLGDSGFPGAVVVHFGSDTELLVRLPSGTGESAQLAATNVGEQIVAALREVTPEVQIDVLRSEVIGAQMGEELVSDGILGVLAAFGGIFLYVAVRFQRKFSAGAVVALVHDVILVLGLFSITQLEVDLTVLAAVLAVIGYSINDTIVVADRIRENFRIMRVETVEEIVDTSLSQTLGRTLLTSGSTLLVLFALLFVGGELIQNFSIALIVGIAVGTYSSIYIAAAIMLWMNLTREDLMPPVKEGAEQEELP